MSKGIGHEYMIIFLFQNTVFHIYDKHLQNANSKNAAQRKSHMLLSCPVVLTKKTFFLSFVKT